MSRPTAANPNLLEVDWSTIPAPIDDGAARHLEGLAVPDLALAATDGTHVSLTRQPGRVVVFAYPRTGRPGESALADDWDRSPARTAARRRDLLRRVFGGRRTAAPAVGATASSPS